MRFAVLRMLLAVAGLCLQLGVIRAGLAQEAAAPGRPAGDRGELFERRVRPVLAERCFECHGPQKQQAGLRLDSRESLLKGGDDGPVVDLKNPRASLLLRAIGYDDPNLQMPPQPAGKLPEAEIAALTSWIEQGAYWPSSQNVAAPATDSKTHWAFQSLRSAPVPNVRQSNWPRSPIDSFVLAALEAENMIPSPPADRSTLIRRASFDLIGLPPSDQEIEAFVKDPSPQAFATVVERLLDSPHYGERWGRHWLDVARYAETKGYVRLQEERRFHHAYTYRDYVIRAFNEDLPFDQFIVEQLAADQLPADDDPRRLAALGFLTLGRRFTGNKHDIIDDRIDVVTRGLLGLTVTCARCHDHKYDPISTVDYYSLYGIFASSADPIVPPLAARPAADTATIAFERELTTRVQALEDYEPKQHAALVDEFRARAADYLVAAVPGHAPPQQPLPKAVGEIRQVVVDRWIDSIERAGPEDPVLGLWHALAALKPAEFAAQSPVVIGHWPAAAEGDPPRRVNALVKNWFVEHPPASMIDVARGYGGLLAAVHTRWQSLLVSTIAAGSGALERFADADEESLRDVLHSATSPVAVSRQEAIDEYLYDAPINAEIYKRRNAINEHLAQTSVGPPRAHALVELPTSGDPRVLVRGNPIRPGKTVPRQFLSLLSTSPQRPFAPATARRELARAIVDRGNPLTARVIVNRVWAEHFGAGLVRSTSNFGLRGEAPSHPQLLDYLAARFMDEGWSIKKLHRWIMLTSTYQQASVEVADQRARDPENRLLWRANRRRLDFEAFRDALLVAAGRLDRALGGPSVDVASPAVNRRTVYAIVDRQGLPGMFPTFDFASPEAHSPARYTTTVPQQALFLMNAPLPLAMARSLAARDDVKNIEEPAERARRMMTIVWGRRPSDLEVARCLEFIAGDGARPAGGADPDAWEVLAQALLLSNEFAYVD